MTVENASILVVDDEPDERDVLSAVLARAGHVVRCADSVATALTALGAEPPPDLILLDLGMPGVGGLALLVEVREAARTAGVPVIVVSGSAEASVRVESLDAGANDYITKPVNGAELLARMRNLLRAGSELERLRRGSFLDSLTGLLNRVGLDHLLGLQVELAIRQRSPLAVLFVDLDGFKRVNDDRGHAAGDRVLCDVARALEVQLRGCDFAARWGGDEFVVVLPGAAPAMARGVIARLEGAVAGVATSGIALSASIGMTCLFEDVPPGADTARRLVERADEAMYRVKHSHRVAGAPSAMVPRLPCPHLRPGAAPRRERRSPPRKARGGVRSVSRSRPRRPSPGPWAGGC